jgi:hypothetical protein
VEKPDQGYIKVNCDANLSKNVRWDIEAIFREEMRRILAATTWETAGDPNPIHAEAQALYNTMRLAVECCFTFVIFESDNQHLVQVVKTEDMQVRSYLGNYV